MPEEEILRFKFASLRTGEASLNTTHQFYQILGAVLSQENVPLLGSLVACCFRISLLLLLIFLLIW